jgi:acetylornithine deacetylase/succinyl-diaminopimelate desuccinylase-like protein
LVDPDHPLIATAAEALKQVWGRETVYIRSGGSIPIVGEFQKHLGIPTILMGFGLPDDGLHSPNEKFSLENFHKGILSTARFLELL